MVHSLQILLRAFLRRTASSTNRRDMMKELLEAIVKPLVQYPDEVNVTLTDREDSQLLELRVNPSDMGKVIGRQGRIAKAIRTVMRAASGKDGKKIIVDIVED